MATMGLFVSIAVGILSGLFSMCDTLRGNAEDIRLWWRERDMNI